MRRLIAAPLLLAACSNVRPVEDFRHASYVHPDGWTDPNSADFHGTHIANTGWDFAPCQKCHGDDFKGGTSGAACTTCHEQGPTSCTTCHGQPPKTGAHVAHAFDCTSCHVKPAIYSDAGHLDGVVTVTLEKGTYQDKKCSGVYCHGGTFSDSSAKNTTPNWNGGSGEATCGSCHGLPPAGHVSDRCADCHPKQPDGTGPRHVDGKISLGDESGSCSACHTLNPTSGAHVGHLTATLQLRGPLICADCHPATNGDAAHPLTARAANCEKCHGTRPAWTSDPSAAYCGACHAVPPADAPHTPSMILADCATCHPTTMNANGGFVAGGTHLNGVVDAQ